MNAISKPSAGMTTVVPTPLEKIATWVQSRPNDIFLRQPVDGNLIDFTWKEVDNQLRRMAAAFLDMGLEPGDRVAILAKNCAEWFITDYALQMVGLISVPLYPLQSPDSIEYVLNHSGSKAILIGKLDDPTSMESGIPDHVKRIAMPYPMEMRVDYHWNDLLDSNEPYQGKANNKQDDLLTIIYTSGTTGNPKGVMHTYATFGFGAEASVNKMNMDGNDRYLSFLPLSHIAERFMVLGTSTFAGATVYFVESLDTFARDLQASSPTVFFAVPRIWKKFQQQINDKLPQKKLDLLLSIPLINRLIKRKIAKGLGLSKARIIISGASPIARSLLDWYDAIGIEINEGYGMTENLAYGPAINLPGEVKLGTVGSINALPGSEVQLTEEGEVIVRSPTLMTGYYLDEEKTAETIRDGWLHTGDRGEIDQDGYLRITGRTKDAFKTSKGKFIQPNKIEGLLARNTDFEQICVAGSGHSQPFVLVELTEEARSHLPARKKELENSMLNTITEVNKELDHHELISRVFVIKDIWSPENGMLTPTLKIKRNLVEDRYAELSEKYRDSKDKVVWES